MKRISSIGALFLWLPLGLLVCTGPEWPSASTGHAAPPVPQVAKTPAPAKPQILAQEKVGENACGPCAIYNCFNWGDTKLREALPRFHGNTPQEKTLWMIERYGKKKSEEYSGKQPRYNPELGVTWHDLTHFSNDLCQELSIPAVAGNYLDRQKDEKSQAYLHRVHQILLTSLEMGWPPVIALRSFGAKREASGEYLWHGLHGHWVTLVDLPRHLDENERGFRIGFLDSSSGKEEFAYVYVEDIRPYSAAKGNREHFEWLSGSPFLLVQAPSLHLKTQTTEWHERTTITLNYAVHRRKL